MPAPRWLRNLPASAPEGRASGASQTPGEGGQQLPSAHSAKAFVKDTEFTRDRRLAGHRSGTYDEENISMQGLRMQPEDAANTST